MITYYPKLKDIEKAALKIKNIMKTTPLQFHESLSNKYNSSIYLKREDLTIVRSYKIRGAYNKMSSLTDFTGIVSCSAGNHAQGVSFCCNTLSIPGHIFMPKITTKQKIDKVKKFGGKYVTVYLEGDSFDDSYDISNKFCKENNLQFIHPFDDEKVIEGQATVGLEILQQIDKPIDYLFLPIGGGGLSSGVSSYFKFLSPLTKLIGVQPMGSPSMYKSFLNNKITKLDKINSFVDGAAVGKSGELNFPICKKNLDDILLIEEGQVCSKILEMYNDSGLIIEPAGVLSLCALDQMKEKIKNKNVVSIISGGNSDVFRMPEILDRSLVWEGRKHYFKIEFQQRAGALREFILNVLGKNDDIVFFKYTKLINQEMGPVIIGIETKSKDDIQIVIEKMKACKLNYEKVSNVAEL